MNNGELNLASLSHLFVNENAAREFVERQRWPDGPVCPHCQSKNVYKLTAKPGSKNPVPPGVYKCECREKFTVRIGTIYEDSKLPLSKWLMAFHLMTSSKKGVSSHQIARELGITVKSAWFLTHRIREAMKKQPVAGLLQGVVEVDETYVGGKPRKGDGKKHKRGWGTPKQPVLVLVERDGSAWAKPIENTTAKTLKNEIAVHVAREAVIMTDELHSYWALDRLFARHETITHGAGEYSRKAKDGLNVHTNTGESFFALLKRGHYGIFHQLSKKHLHRYCNQFSFRWDHRQITDGERMVAAIRGVEGRRLTYRPLKETA